MDINYIEVNIHRNIDVEELLQRLTGAIREGISNGDYKLVMMCEDAIAVIETMREEIQRQHSKLVKQTEMLNRGNESAETVAELCGDEPNCFEKYDPTKAYGRGCKDCRFWTCCMDKTSERNVMEEIKYKKEHEKLR